MADYFISPTDGSDSTGTGAWDNPWKTVGKAIGASAAITLPGSGLTRVVIEGGAIVRETVTLGLSPSAGAPLAIVGDVDGAILGAAGAANPKTGDVSWRAWTSDTAVMNASALVISGKSYVTLENLRVVGGTRNSTPYPGSAIDLDGATNITIRDCELIGHHDPSASTSVVRLTVAAGANANVLIERCLFVGASDGQNGLRIVADEHSADYDTGVVVRNCLFQYARDGIRLEKGSGSGGGAATGLQITGVTIAGAIASSGSGVRVLGWAASAEPMAVIRLCAVVSSRIGFAASDASQVDEDYNFLHSGFPRSNVSIGANSLVGFPGLNFSGKTRPFAEPLAGSPVLEFAARPAGLDVDLYGRERPDPCAAGCLERVDPADPDEPGGITYIFQTEG